MAEVIRRRQTCLGKMTVRIGTPEKAKRFNPDPRSYWVPELQSGKPYVRYKATHQSPKRGKWGEEETRSTNYGVLGRQAKLAAHMLEVR